MSDIQCPVEKFQALVQPLVGLTVSHPWKGYGTAVFFELGALTRFTSPRLTCDEGEACISVEWDWRVEAGAKILYGSSNSRPEMIKGIAGLKGATILSLSLVGPVPELVVQFSNGQCLRSMCMATGDPEWSVKIPDGRWVYAKDGRLFADNRSYGLTAEEKAVFDQAERTTTRWGMPTAEPKRGSCADCVSFIRLDGEFGLLDYGACIAEGGPFDGRIVNSASGCSSFKGRETVD